MKRNAVHDGGNHHKNSAHLSVPASLSLPLSFSPSSTHLSLSESRTETIVTAPASPTLVPITEASRV